ncbi:alpha/beta hydrolase family protein [Paenibacillus sp. NPDC056933]|uniref:alpha/beta hydrolase family protein n=1 Tax=Paenibacillus sp. NPDC056933 TaxID=3345968 RepID=UPI00363D8C4F
MKKVILTSIIASVVLAGSSLPASAQSDLNLGTSASAVTQKNIKNESSSDNEENTVRGELLSYKKVSQLTTKQILKLNPAKDIRSLLSYDVSLYSITYKSIYNGEPVVLSGLVTIPKGKKKPSYLQYHHGTMLPIPMTGGEGSNDAPSLFHGQPAQLTADFGETRMMILTLASKGYVVSAPDYAGYNVSKNLDHPYNVASELAESSVDMLRATKELTRKLQIKTDNKVFLAGWSEGGGAALATHKLIEQKHVKEFNLIATSPLAGPYDSTSMILESANVEGDIGENAAIYNWTLYSLIKFGNIDRPHDEVWKYEVNSSLDALMTPSNKVSEIIQESFLENVINGKDGEVLAAIKGNDLIQGWTPKAKIMFHSGKHDDIVPHYNTLNAYNTFKERGADVTLYEYEGNHYTPDLKYLTRTIKDFGVLSRK